jgi:hypothetical protein
MCSNEFKKKVEELTSRFKAEVDDKRLYQIIEQLVLSDPESAELLLEEVKAKQKLNLKLEPQPVNHDIIQTFLPEKWELPRGNGRLLYSDEEIQRALMLLMFNLGIEKSLEIVPIELIEKYLSKKKKKDSNKNFSGNQ